MTAIMLKIQAKSVQHKIRGFTLIELIMVMVVLGILAVIGYSKLFSRSVFEERGFFEETMQATRYAQKQAIAWGCDVQISFTATTYALSGLAGGCTPPGFSGPVTHPVRAGSYSGTVPKDVTLGPVTTIRFDRIGRPRNAAGSLLAANTNISVGGFSFRIVPETGYVYEP